MTIERIDTMLDDAAPRPSRAGQKMMDALGQTLAVVSLLVLLPLLVLIALAVKLDSTGPALFAQTRVGKDGRLFKVLKFRTMVPDAESRQADLTGQNEYGNGPFFKVRTDPRITRVGAFLRKTSLDELPQLANVAIGDMALVGPRPITIDETLALGSASLTRQQVKPGITGLWQVSGRSETSAEERVALDEQYVRERRPMLDLKILTWTVRSVLRGRGAY